MQTGQDVVTLQLRMIGQDLILTHAGGNEIEDHLHRPAQMTDTGFAMANVRVESNTAQIRHDGISVVSMHEG